MVLTLMPRPCARMKEAWAENIYLYIISGMGTSKADHMTSKEALYGVDTFNMSCTTMEGLDAEKDSLLLPQNTVYKATLLQVLLDILRREEGWGGGVYKQLQLLLNVIIAAMGYTRNLQQ